MQLSTLCYIEHDEAYLMLYRNKKENDLNEGKWIGVGGKFEQEESPEECLLREVKEETGFLLTDYTFRGIVTFVSDEWETQYMHLYTASEFEGKLNDTCKEGQLRWIKKEEIKKLSLWEGDRIFLELIQEEHAFFSLKLCYEGDCLVTAKLDGEEIVLPIIRRVRPVDAATLHEIEKICFPKEEAASLEAIADRIAVFGEQFLILEVGGTPVGFINGMTTEDETIADVMYEDSSLHNADGKWQTVFGLDVLPQYRRKGYGERLMNAFIQQAKRAGKVGVILTCKEEKLHYYEKFGYRKIGLSASVHGGARWYDMSLRFQKNKDL